MLPPTAGSLAHAAVPPMAGTQAHTLRVGVVAYQDSVAKLVAAAHQCTLPRRSSSQKGCRAAEPILLPLHTCKGKIARARYLLLGDHWVRFYYLTKGTYCMR